MRYNYMANSLDDIVRQAGNIARDVIPDDNDISGEITKVATTVFERYQVWNNPWWRGVDMIELLSHLGRPNVRNHLERLVDKGVLEGKLHKSNKVYRLRRDGKQI